MQILRKYGLFIAFVVGMFTASIVSKGLIPALFTLGRMHPALPWITLYFFLIIIYFLAQKNHLNYLRYFLFGFSSLLLALGFSDFATILNTKWRNPLEETTKLFQKLFLASYSGLIERMLALKERDKL